MKVRRSRWENDPVRGRNRVLKNPNQLTPEMLWNQHRLATVDVVTPTVPRGTAPSGGLPDGAVVETGTGGEGAYILDYPTISAEIAGCACLNNTIDSNYLEANYTVGLSETGWYWRLSKWAPGDEYTLDTYRDGSPRGWSAPVACDAACNAVTGGGWSFGGTAFGPDPYQQTFALGAGAKYLIVRQTGGISNFKWTVFVDAAAYGA